MIADRGSDVTVRRGFAARPVIVGGLLAIAMILGACSAAATPAPSPGAPSPTAGAPSSPDLSPITTAEAAAAAVAATNARLAGIEQKNPDMIGQGSFWEATPISSGAYGGGSPAGWKVTYTVGWGDCPAGCIYEHMWTYQVDADGTVTLLSETGDPLESGAS